MKEVTQYFHASAESLINTGEGIGLNIEAVNLFRHWSELKVKALVEETGAVKQILEVNDLQVMPRGEFKILANSGDRARNLETMADELVTLSQLAFADSHKLRGIAEQLRIIAKELKS